jgi:excisionase family DNA binding protein
MLSAEETAGRLDVSVKYLYKLTSGNRIPFYKPNGKKIYFDEVDVDKYLRRKRAFTKEELESNS